jgi:H+-transporting ATPase
MSVDSIKMSKALTGRTVGSNLPHVVLSTTSPSTEKSANPEQTTTPKGLTSSQARTLMDQIGPNAVPDTTVHPLRSALAKFWSPVPWMLEAAVVLQLFLGEYVEATIIGVLLVFNAALGFLQE